MNTGARPPEPGTIRDGYDRWSSVYDHDANPLVGLEEPFMRAQLGSARGLAVLDLGCGMGRHALWLGYSRHLWGLWVRPGLASGGIDGEWA